MAVDPRVIRGVIGKAKVVLSSKQFRYFQLHFEFELTVKEIAKEVNKSESSIYRTLRRAKETMKREWR